MATTAEILTKVEAALTGTLDRGVSEYSVSTGAGPRALRTFSVKELLDLRDRLKAQIAREANNNALSFGHGVAEPQS